MEKIIWQYWENVAGKPKPPHIVLCEKILRRRLGSCRLEIVNSESLYDFIPDIHPNIEHITRADRDDEPSIAIKAGILRVLLLERYGGLWIDTDAIVLKSLDSVFALFDQYEFIGMRRDSSKRKQVVNNFFGSKPGGAIITEYAALIRELLLTRTSFVWNEVGSISLTPIVERHLNSVYLFPEEKIHPLVPKDQPLLLQPDVEPQDVIPEDAITLMLFHRIFDGAHQRAGDGFKDYSIEDMYNSNTLLGKIIRNNLPLKQEEIEESSADDR